MVDCVIAVSQIGHVDVPFKQFWHNAMWLQSSERIFFCSFLHTTHAYLIQRSNVSFLNCSKYGVLITVTLSTCLMKVSHSGQLECSFRQSWHMDKWLHSNIRTLIAFEWHQPHVCTLNVRECRLFTNSAIWNFSAPKDRQPLCMNAVDKAISSYFMISHLSLSGDFIRLSGWNESSA